MRYLWLGILVIFLFPYCLVFSGPGLMGCLTLGISFLSSFVVGLTRSTWYGVSVWLVYISGMLVLFLFFCSLAPNPSFYSPHGIGMSLLMGGCFFFVVLYYSCSSGFDMVDSHSLWVVQPFFLLGSLGSFIYCWMGAYLFFVMIVVVKISPKMGGAVRMVK